MKTLVKPAGSKVRCSKCKHVFVAYPPKPDADPELPAEPAPTVPDSPQVAGFEFESTDDESAPSEPESVTAEDFRAEAFGDLADENSFDTEQTVDEEFGFSLDMDTEETASGDGGEELGDLRLPDDDLSPGSGRPETGTGFRGVTRTCRRMKPEAIDELDLSELEKILELDEADDAETPAAQAETPEAFEFDFENADRADLSDAREQAEIAAEELDISDIESILDLDDAEIIPEDEPEDAELEFDIELETDPVPESTEPEVEFEADELDLSDLEGILEMEDAPETEDEGADDLDLDLEFDEPDAEEVYGLDGAETVDGDDLELEFEMGVDEEPAPVTAGAAVDMAGDKAAVKPAAAAAATPRIEADRDYDLPAAQNRKRGSVRRW